MTAAAAAAVQVRASRAAGIRGCGPTRCKQSAIRPAMWHCPQPPAVDPKGVQALELSGEIKAACSANKWAEQVRADTETQPP